MGQSMVAGIGGDPFGTSFIDVLEKFKGIFFIGDIFFVSRDTFE